MKKALKHPAIIFSSILVALLIAAVVFVQSAPFARLVKSVVSEHIPSDLGIGGDFSDFRVKVFPPGIAINRPKLELAEKNVLNLPKGSRVEAERIDFNFYTLQMLSGRVRLSEVIISKGVVQLRIDPDKLRADREKNKQKKKIPLKIEWDDLFQIQVQALTFQDTTVELEVKDSKAAFGTKFRADDLTLEKTGSAVRPGYMISLRLSEIELDSSLDWLLPRLVDRVQAEFKLDMDGLEIDHFELQRGETMLEVSGGLQGDVLNPSSLRLDSRVGFKGDIGEILNRIGLEKLSRRLEGWVAFSGAVKGDPMKLGETLEMEGQLRANRVRFDQWHADEFFGEGAFRFSAEEPSGLLAIRQIEVNDARRERQGGKIGGRGGQVKVGAFEYRFGAAEPLVANVELKDAHLHWLAAPGIKDVFPMDFRVSGPIGVVFSPATKATEWQIKADMNLEIPRFVLDNQRLDQAKPMRSVVEAKELRLAGSVNVDARGFKADGLKLTFPGTEFDVAGGLNFKSGYGFRVVGETDLEKGIISLAGNTLRGKGKLVTDIEGPASHVRVTFDAQLKDAYYLNLQAGDVSGKIIYDDGVNDIEFKGVEISKNRTNIQASGKLDVGKKETVDLGFKVTQGDIQDLIVIFENLHKDFWWFPRELIGETTGTIRVTGGLNLAELKVLGHLNGTEWSWWGERFHTIAIRGGYDRGAYIIEDFAGTKRGGKLLGSISHDDAKGLQWNIRTENFSLADLDMLARSDVPFRGRVRLRSTGAGRSNMIQSTSDLEIDQLVVRGIAMPSSQLSVSVKDNALRMSGSAEGGRVKLDLRYSLKKGGASRLDLECKDFDFSPALLVLNPRLIRDEHLSGRISGLLDLSFPSGEIELASGRAELTQYVLAKTDTSYSLTKPVRVALKNGSFPDHDLVIKGNQGEGQLRIGSKRGVIRGRATGSLDISALEFLTSAIVKAEGLATLALDFEGKLKEPKVSGRAEVQGGRLKVRSFESPIENLRAAVQLDQNIALIRSIRADMAGGRVFGNGKVEFFSNRYPEIDVKLQLDNNRIKIFPFQYAKVQGGLRVLGNRIPYTVGGEIRIDSALSKEKIFDDKRGRARKSALYTPPPSGLQESDYPTFKLNIHAVADGDVWVNNELFDAELKSDVTIVNTLAAPRLLGAVDLVKGKMKFKNQEFQLRSGRIEFDNPAVIDPKFSVTATTDVNNIAIQLFASGKLSQWKVELSSNPAKSQDEILNLINTGLSPEDIQRLRAADRASLQQGEIASILLHSVASDFNKGVQDKLGVEIEIDEAVDTQSGQSISRPQVEGTASAAPKIVIKRRIGKNVSVSAGSTVPGIGTNSQREASVEAELTPSVSVRGVVNQFEGQQTEQNQTSMGVDVKYQKRFK